MLEREKRESTYRDLQNAHHREDRLREINNSLILQAKKSAHKAAVAQEELSALQDTSSQAAQLVEMRIASATADTDRARQDVDATQKAALSAQVHVDTWL